MVFWLMMEVWLEKYILILLKKETKLSNPSSHLSNIIRKLYVFKMKTFTFIYVVCTSNCISYKIKTCM